MYPNEDAILAVFAVVAAAGRIQEKQGPAVQGSDLFMDFCGLACPYSYRPA
jgi:hypothetical protein